MKNLSKTLNLLGILSVFFGILLVLKPVHSQENLYRSQVVFVGAEHILSIDDVMDYYILDPDERETLKVLLSSPHSAYQQHALNRVKEALMDVFIEEMFIEEGKRLYTELKGKIQGRKIFLIDQSKQVKSFSMGEIRRERVRVKRIVEQYYLSRLGHTHPFIALEEDMRHGAMIPKEPRHRPLHEYVFIPPQDVRNYYETHYESLAQPVTLYEVKFESPIIMMGAFLRENMSDSLKARMRNIFFGALDKEGVCASPLTEESKDELWQFIIDPAQQEKSIDSLLRSLHNHADAFMGKGVNIEKLKDLSLLAYELGVRLVGADLHSLRTLNSDQEYVQGTIRIQEEFNRIFPGLIKTRNVQDFSRDVFNSPDTFNLQIFQELHGRFSFEWGLRERDAHPLMYSDSQALKVPAFFKFRVLWEHQGDN